MKKILLFIFMSAWAGALFAESITFDQALQVSLERNTTILKAEKDLAIAEARVEQAYGMFDFKLDGNVNYSDSKTEATTPLAPEQTKVLSYKLGLSEKTMLGGFFSLDLNSSKIELLYPTSTAPISADSLDLAAFTSSVNPSYNPTLSISYTQPILKDFLGRPDQIALDLAAYLIQLSQEALKKAVVDLIGSLNSAYLGIYQAEAMLMIQEDALTDTKKYYNQTVRMKKIGLRETKDIYQTQASFLKAKAGISTAKDRVKQGKENFYNLAGYDESAWLTMDIQAAPLFEEFPIPQSLTVDQEQTLVEKQSVVILSGLQTKMSGLSKKIADNATLPALSLFGKYGVEGIDEGWGQGYSEMFSNKYGEYAVGINFSMNFPNRTNEGDLKIKEQDLEKAEEDLKALKRTLIIQIRYAYKKLVSSKEKYELTKEARLFSEKSLEIHNQHFSQGRITTRELLGAQSEYHGARMEEVTALIGYMNAVNEWNKMSGEYDHYHKLVKE